MSAQLNLKDIERKAYRSIYQDGLLDIEMGLVVIFMSIFIYRPPQGYSPANIVFLVLLLFVANIVYTAGKYFITRPRIGKARFGPARKKKWTTLAIFLGVIILLQVILLGVTAQGWLNQQTATAVNDFLTSRRLMDAAVAAIGALIVGSSLTLMAYFLDYPRGYYIALMASLAVFLMIYLNQPIYAIIIGVLILVPGVVSLVRFIREHPLPKEVPDEH
jgi:hypothetical protein